MRVLVTGSSGFSGSYTARRLAEAGHDVVGLYRRETPFLAGLRQQPAVRLIQSDLAGAPALPGPFEAVVHIGATSPAPGITAAAIVRDNVAGTSALLDAAAAWGCRAFIFFSSLSLYGEITRAVVDEACPIVNPDVYGATKLIGETLVAERADAMPGIALRLPGVLGPGAHRNWLSGVAAKLTAGETIRAFHLDSLFNNAAHIEDIARLVRSLLQREWSGFDSMVLGARGAVTVREAIERLARGLGQSARIEVGPAAKPSFILSPSHAIDRWSYDPMEIGALIDRYARETASADPSSRP